MYSSENRGSVVTNGKKQRFRLINTSTKPKLEATLSLSLFSLAYTASVCGHQGTEKHSQLATRFDFFSIFEKHEDRETWSKNINMSCISNMLSCVG